MTGGRLAVTAATVEWQWGVPITECPRSVGRSAQLGKVLDKPCHLRLENPNRVVMYIDCKLIKVQFTPVPDSIAETTSQVKIN